MVCIPDAASQHYRCRLESRYHHAYSCANALEMGLDAFRRFSDRYIYTGPKSSINYDVAFVHITESSYCAIDHRPSFFSSSVFYIIEDEDEEAQSEDD